MVQTSKKKQKKHGNKNNVTIRKIVRREDDQIYALAIKPLGDRRLSLLCNDGTEKIGIVRGAMRKRCWINRGDIVLATLRDFQDGRLDIIHKYIPEDIRSLQKDPLEKTMLCNLVDNNRHQSTDGEIVFNEYDSDSNSNSDEIQIIDNHNRHRDAFHSDDDSDESDLDIDDI